MKKHFANILTCSRAIISIILLFFEMFSPRFWVLYLLCGVSDMIDGTVARKMGTESKFGSRLDSVADFIFMSAVLIRLLPIMRLPRWVWLWIFLVAAIKVSAIMLGFIKNHKLIVMHTVMNKFTGLLLFLLPLAAFIIDIKYSISLACFFATIAAIQEWYYIWNDKEEEF